ncbi:MAG: GntR family transcriptional regulator [Hespellia sp.]|nr:GntR family transcriptional regulator [Hespellia sp.]
MQIIIQNSSEIPIYEQISMQIKAQIVSAELKEHDLLPSVRGLAKELKISALTVKKAYDYLEEQGFIVTVHGKGSFIASTNAELVKEELRSQVDADLEIAIQKAKSCGMTKDEMMELFLLIWEDESC